MTWSVLEGDARDRLDDLEAGSCRCCVTSPPYLGLRDYGHDDQIGLEGSPEQYVSALVAVFGKVRRVLTDDATLWLNLGDSYAGTLGQGTRGGPPSASSTLSGGRVKLDTIVPVRHRTASTGDAKPKDLLGVPWMAAFALRADGWFLRSDIIWHKANPMPESVRDRPTSAHEHVFLLTKQPRYFYDAQAIRTKDSGRSSGNGFARDHRVTYQNRDGSARGNPDQWTPGGGANARNVWTVPSSPYAGAHVATFPPALAERCILAGTEPGDMVLDPFAGSGTTGMVALRHGRSFVGVELNPGYVRLARDRIVDDAPLFNHASQATA